MDMKTINDHASVIKSIRSFSVLSLDKGIPDELASTLDVLTSVVVQYKSLSNTIELLQEAVLGVIQTQ